MATIADLDEIALALPGTEREDAPDGRPSYAVAGKAYAFHRSPRKDAVDPETGEPMDDVLVLRVPDIETKELVLADGRGIWFTTPHWNGYAAVLVRVRDLHRLDRDELEDAVVDAWLTRAPKRAAKAWLAAHGG